jgi:hypothetical protein
VKEFHKERGWLVKCVGGPSDGVFVRSWCLTGDPVMEAEMLKPNFDVYALIDDKGAAWELDQEGEYRLEMATDKKGNQKMTKYKGTQIPTRQYRWTLHEF